jgi:Ca2+-binding RTX toxin-like protein
MLSITGAGDTKRGIENSNTINTGDGNDTLTGSGGELGIFNVGSIDMGKGNDIVDALNGGFGGNGTTKLGDGNDIVKGFGTGFFDAGNNNDTLLFSPGTYTISGIQNGDGFYTVNNGTSDMFIKDFELIGSASNPDAAVNFSSVIGGTITV